MPRPPNQRDDVTQRTDVKKRAPAQPVNQPKPDKSKHEICGANADGLKQRGFFGQSGHLKYAGREIENRVDAGQLVEKGDQEGEQDWLAQTPGPEMPGRYVSR